jgi:membrane protease YdiL (CAAX protease family)
LPAFDSTPTPRFTRTLNFAMFGTSALWVLASEAISGRAARGLSVRFGLESDQLLLTSLVFLFLLGVGFSMLQAISGRPESLNAVMGLPKRATAREEWGIGAAIGWGCVILAVLPMALGGTLHVHFPGGAHAYWMVVVNLATLLVAALAEEVAFRGYPFRRLIAAMGPVKATISVSILFGLGHAFNPDATWISVLITMLAGVGAALCLEREHGGAVRAAGEWRYGLFQRGDDACRGTSLADGWSLWAGGSAVYGSYDSDRHCRSGAAYLRLCMGVHASSDHCGWISGRGGSASSAYGDGAGGAGEASGAGADSADDTAEQIG